MICSYKFTPRLYYATVKYKITASVSFTIKYLVQYFTECTTFKRRYKNK